MYMKKLIVVAVAVVMVMGLVGSAMAAEAASSASNSLQRGNMGINVGMGDSLFSVKAVPMAGAGPNDVVNVTGKYFIANDLAILATFGFQSDGSDYDGTYISFGGGVRKYLSTSTTGAFNTFADVKLVYASVDSDTTGADMSIIDISGMFGAEYFFSRQFSLEGAVGVGIGQLSDGNFDDLYLGTRTVGVSANFYF
jgi:hypothetical protein